MERAFLEGTGYPSILLMEHAAQAVIAALRKRGWKGSLPKPPKVRPEFAELLKKINALRLETKKPWAYVEAIAKRMYGVGLSWLDGEQLGGVITALVKHQRAQENGNAGA